MRAREGGMIVSRAFANHHWPNESPIGKGVRFTGKAFYRVIGIAEDVRSEGVAAPATEFPYFPMIAIPDSPLYYWGKWSPTFMYFVVKTTRPDAMALSGDIARIARDIEPQVVADNATTMETVVARSYARQSFTMALLLIAAGIALLLSAVGIYGVLSYLVQQRRGEIGVRVALGAQLGDVTSLVLRQSLVLAGVGVVAGVAGALATTRFLSVLLYGVQPADPLTLALVPALLLGVALLASYLPARRAARIDPVEALRSE
jgi:ABC-type antimicrobial peptide transport system permease subunit